MALFGQFTERAQRVMAAAQQVAAEYRHRFVGTEHLLCGLMQESVILPPAITEHASLPLVRQRLTEPSADNPNPTGRVELTPQLKQVLEISVLEARRMGSAYVGVEHLWLGIVRVNGSAPGRAR